MLHPMTFSRFLGFLLFCTVLLTIVAAKKDDDDEPASGECSGRLIPGIEKMARGVDITELDLFPADLQQRNGFRKPVIELTCAKKHKWVHPSVEHDTEYAKPDQVSGINTNSAGDMTAKMDISGESEDFKVSQLAKVGLGVDTVAYGSYSASVSYKNAQENLYRRNQSLAETSATVSSIYIDFHSAGLLNVSEDFQYSLNQLKSSYESIPDQYDTLIDTFGTHYFETGTLGGYIYQKTLLNEAYTMSTTETEIKANLAASYKVVTATAEASEEKKKISDSFKKNSVSTLTFFGGTPVAIDSSEPAGKFLETWVPTVNRDPWLFGGQLKPIERLIKNQALAREVKKAISLKKARAYLAEIRRLVTIGQFTLGQEETLNLEDIEGMLSARRSGDIERIVKELDRIQHVLREMRDRYVLIQMLIRLRNQPAIDCKTQALRCLRPKYGDTDYYRQAFRTVDQEMLSLQPMHKRILALSGKANEKPPINHEEARKALNEARALVSYLDNKVVDLCSGSWASSCNGCRYLDGCTDPTIKRLIGWK